MLLWHIYVYGGDHGQTLRDSYIIDPSILPTFLSTSLQVAVASYNPKAYENVTRGYDNALKSAIVVPDSDADTILPMFFYDVAMVPRSSYYIKKSGEAVLYDAEGNELTRFGLTPFEMMTSLLTRIGCMLDPMWIHRARPRRIKIAHHEKMGRSVYYYDVNDNLLACQRYNGEATLKALETWTNGDPNGRTRKVDFAWMNENGVAIEVDKQECVMC